MKFNEVSLLRVWMAVTVVFVGSFLVWTFMPILIPFAAVFAMLAGLTAVISSIARYAEKKRRGE